MTKNVLVTGGAGFIGSHAAKALSRAGYFPVVLDDLSRGHRELVRWGNFEQGSIGDTRFVAEVLKKYQISSVMHFAAFAYVGESKDHPALYYENNVAQSVRFLEAIHIAGVHKIVFSSSCAVYGASQEGKISESHPLLAINPYGRTKYMMEQMLADYHSAYGLSSVSLRYFNAAGSDPDLETGELHLPETHLIPLAVEAALLGPRQALTVHGSDYPTGDGTCVRDYIHVCDLADAHVAALKHLESGPSICEAFNLGGEVGYSVKQVIEAVEEVVGRKILVNWGPRRPGDPPSLIANSSKAHATLGWKVKYSDLRSMVRDTYRWMSSRNLKLSA